MKHKQPVTRREFIRGSACGGLGVALGMAARQTGAAAENQSTSSGKSLVVVIRDEAVMDEQHHPRKEAVKELMQNGLLSLTGQKSMGDAWKMFVSPANSVAIKGNVMMTPTHPELTSAIMQGIHDLGVAADKIRIWDRNQGGIGPEKADHRMWDWQPGFGEDHVSLAVAEADVLLNVPGLKSHWLSGIGAALKNWCGAVNGINVRDQDASFSIHGDSCADMGILNAIPAIREKTRLVIVDALRPLCSGGPQVDPRYLWDYNGLVLGTDPVAVDMVCLKILQGKRDQLRPGGWPLSPPPKHVAVAAEKYHLGVHDLNRIEIRKIGWEQDCFL
ncbi:MAG: DUF362 domain-containing protein [Candidatus Omnitrophota bacterium]|jgi:uncharacterized protein (DUF362 family)|nr:MAG: DUF362 domain-containing protein [Candidatus Omnitrophota bacterium]